MSRSPESQPDATTSWGRRGWLVCQRLLLYYLVFLLLLSLMQRRLMYVPTPAESLPVSKGPWGMGAGQDISFRTEDGLELHGWHLLPAGQRLAAREEFDRSLTGKSQFVFLYFSGNGGNRRLRDMEFSALTRLPAHVIAFDYRGYGENKGSPSEAGFAGDAQAAWNYVTKTRGVDPERVLIYGESLGGGVATRLAAELCLAKTPPGGLILCSTFSSMVDVACYHYPWLPVRLVLKDRFLSDVRIKDVSVPLLMLHGERDRIVPYRLGRRLFDVAPAKSTSGIPKTFIDLPKADHNDIMLIEARSYDQGLRDFLKSLRK